MKNHLTPYFYSFLSFLLTSEPMQVAETFAAELPSEVLAEQQKGNDAALALGSLHEVARLDSCTTVIDASTFFDMFENAQTVQEDAMGQEENLEEGDDRNLVGLLTEQVEFADLIVLNKTDLLSVLQLNMVRTAVKIMNPHARIVDSSFGKVPLKTLLNTNRFDMEACTKWVDHGSRWFAELPGSHNPESLEYGIGSFIYRNANKPFHPKRLYEWVVRVFNVSANQAVMTSHDSYEHAAAAHEEVVVEEKDTATREEAENNKEGGNVEVGKDDDDEVEDDDEEEDVEDVEDDGFTYSTGASLRKSWKEMMGDDSRLLRSKGCVWMAGTHSHNFRIVWGHTGPYLHLEVDDPWKVRRLATFYFFVLVVFVLFCSICVLTSVPSFLSL
jgi:G3E family GTPase